MKNVNILRLVVKLTPTLIGGFNVFEYASEDSYWPGEYKGLKIYYKLWAKLQCWLGFVSRSCWWSMRRCYTANESNSLNGTEELNTSHAVSKMGKINIWIHCIDFYITMCASFEWREAKRKRRKTKEEEVETTRRRGGRDCFRKEKQNVRKEEPWLEGHWEIGST